MINYSYEYHVTSHSKILKGNIIHYFSFFEFISVMLVTSQFVSHYNIM